MPDSTLSRRSAALLRVDAGDRCFVRRTNFTRKLQKNLEKALSYLGTLSPKRPDLIFFPFSYAVCYAPQTSTK
jgi:hypothetical protein